MNGFAFFLIQFHLIWKAKGKKITFILGLISNISVSRSNSSIKKGTSESVMFPLHPTNLCFQRSEGCVFVGSSDGYKTITNNRVYFKNLHMLTTS